MTLIAAAKAVPPVPTIVVVSPCDETSLRRVVDSAGAGFIDPVLVGPEAKITVSASARSASRTTWSRHHWLFEATTGSLSGSLLALMNSEKSFGPAAHLLTRSI
jgi:hypothetical protein